MALDDRVRDRLLHKTTRLVRASNGVTSLLGPPFADMALRWSVRIIQLINNGVTPYLSRQAPTFAADIIDAGLPAYLKAYSILEESFASVAHIYHEELVDLLNGELARAVREEVTRDELATGTAIAPISDEMADVLADLTINGETLAELRDVGTLRQSESLRRIFRVAAMEGWRPHRLTHEVAAVADLSRKGAETLARTGIMSISNEINRRVYERNADIVKAREYVATLDSRTCLICAADDRKRFRLGDGPSLPRHPRCRCVYVPVTKTWRELGIPADEISPSTRAAMDGPVAGETTFSAWIKRQDKVVQLDVLGPSRYALFQQGTPITTFVNDGRVLTLDQLRKKGIGG